MIKIVLLLFLSFTSCSFNKIPGVYVSEYSDYKTITLKKDNTFDAKIYNYTLGKGEYFVFSGNWKLEGKQVVLNSYRVPNNSNLVQVKEFTDNKIHSDSITIRVSTDWGVYLENGDSVGLIPVHLLKKDKWIVAANNGIIVLSKKELENLRFNTIFSDYPAIKIDTEKHNHFEITLITPKEEDIFQPYSYFDEEKFILKGKKIIEINSNNEWVRKSRNSE